MKMKSARIVLLAVMLCFSISFSTMYISPALAHRHHSRTVWVPAPTGNPAIDTPNIQDALDTACAHRGWTVKLRSGIYVIDKPIDVVNFDGTLKGAGRSKTFIQNAEVFSIHPGLGYPVFFVFYQDTDSESTARKPYAIHIQDFTIEPIGIPEPSPPYTTGFTGFVIMGAWTNEWDTTISYFDVFINRVGFVGQETPGEGLGYNGFRAIFLRGEHHPENYYLNKRMHGTYSITNCVFNHFGFNLDFWGIFEDSKIIIRDNSFDDVIECMFIRDASNSVIKVTHNTGTNIVDDAVWIANGIQASPWVGGDAYGIDYPELSKCYITYNDFSSELAFESDVIVLVDWTYGFTGINSLRSYILCNDIYLDDATGGGIFGAWLYDSWIVGNTISGHGFMGIYFGLWGDAWNPYWGTLTDDGRGNKIFFNDVSELTLEAVPYYSDWPWYYDPETVAGIWLGPYSSDNLVVHCGNTNDVMDFAPPDANKIIIL